MADFINEIQPVLALINAGLSLAVLAFIIQLVSMMKEALSERMEALKDQKGIVEERLKKAEDDLARTEKWYQREIDELKQQLSGVLDEQDATVQRLVMNPTDNDLEEEVKQALETLLRKMTDLEGRIRQDNDTVDDPQWYLEMAKAFTLSGDWLAAAQHYDKYIQYDDTNWEVHFLRAAAYQNCRVGQSTNLAALRAYGDAIALVPENVDINLCARMHAYRGAAFKRLSRLDEAESELLLAQRWAREEYEITDISYNLACIYAMTKQKDKMLSNLYPIVQRPGWKKIIRSKKEYFRNYWNDPDFQRLIN